MNPTKNTISVTSLLYYIFGILIALLLVSYVIFQARVFIAGPQITILDELGTIQNSRMVTIGGVAENITEIMVNGRAIVTDESGRFAQSIVLENGYTIVSIEARDRYGRETKVERTFVYTPLTLYTP